MTVIVYSKGILAADRSISSERNHLYETCKIVRGQWTVGAFAGPIQGAKVFGEWIESDMQIPLSIPGDDYQGLAFTKDNVFWITDSTSVTVPTDHAYAGGAGYEFALGALDAGVDAATAALIAARRMGCAQYGIDVCSLDTPITRIFAPKGKLNVNTF